MKKADIAKLLAISAVGMIFAAKRSLILQNLVIISAEGFYDLLQSGMFWGL